jgi:hypothetical protein
VVYAAATMLAVWWLAIVAAGADARRGWAFALLLLSPFVLFNATQLMLETAVIALLGATLASALTLEQRGFSARRATVLALLAALCALTKSTALPALALLTAALWPLLGRRVWPLLLGGIVGALVNEGVLRLLHAPSASYGGVEQLLVSLTNPSAERLAGFAGVWAFFAGLPALGAVWTWGERRDRWSFSLMALAWLSAPAALMVQMTTDQALPFPRYAYPVIWVGLAAGAMACARSRARWLAPLVLIVQLPLITALWPGVFNTIALWPSTVVLEAFENGGTILSGTPVHGWVAMSGRQRERLCVLVPNASPGSAQAKPWFNMVAGQVTFFDATQVAEFQQCEGARAIFDRRFDVDPCELDACAPSRYRIRSCLPQHIAFYSPRVGDVRTRVCLP